MSSGPSSSLITAPLSILKSVKTIRDTQFRDLDFLAIEKYALGGVRGLLKKKGAYGKDLGTARATEDGVEEQAEREVSEELSQYLDHTIPKLAAYMESASPLLVKYTVVLDETKQYVKQQVKNCNFLIAQGSMFYAGMLLFFTYKVAQTIRGRTGASIPEVISAVSLWYIAFIVFHFIFSTLLILLKRRKRRFSDVDFGVLDRVNSELATNVFVRFANAYARGVTKEFTQDEIKRRSNKEMEDMEDAEMSVVNRACAETGEDGDTGGTVTYSKGMCVINPCEDDKDLGDTLRKYFKKMMERADPENTSLGVGCDVYFVVAIKNFAELQRGHMFDSSDVRDNWQSVVRGVDDVRMLIMRELDIPPADKGKTPLAVVKEDVIPAFQLHCVETATLKPAERYTEDFKNKFQRHLDKDKCWDLARSDPDCRWAYFVPGKGCVYAMASADYETSNPQKLALDWCPTCKAPRSRSEADFPDDPIDEEFDKGILLLTVNPSVSSTSMSQDDVLFVTTKDAKGIRDDALKKLSSMMTQTSDDTTLIKALTKCAMQTQPDGGDGSCAAVSIKPSDNDSVPERWRHSFMALDYTAFFAEEKDTSNPDRFYLKQSRRKLFEAMKPSGMGSTMSSLRPIITANLTDLMKRNQNRVDIMSYAEYIDTKLKEFYGPQTYVTFDADREIIDVARVVKDVLHDVVKNMEAMGENMSSNVKYVSSMRFSEKMRNMDDRDVKETTVRFGNTAHAAMQLFREAQRSATDSDTDKNIGSRVLESLSVYGLTIAVLILIIYVSNRTVDVMYNRISGVHASAVIMLSVMSVLLLFALVSSMQIRKDSNDKFNKRISEENSRVMVTSVVDARDDFLRETEMRMMKRLERSNASDKRMTAELEALYADARHGDRSEKLKDHTKEKKGPLLEFLQDRVGSSVYASAGGADSDYEPMYLRLRRTVDAFDRCNTLITGPTQAPFPVYEVTMYSVIICLILAALAYSLLQLRFFKRMRHVGVLGEAKSNLSRNRPIDLKYIQNLMADSNMPQSRKDIIFWIVAAIVCFAMIMMMHLIVTSSQGYESGLYASSMYVNNRCTRSRRTADE